jgi:DNA polymerase-1
MNTSAMFGFTNTLNDLIKNYGATHIAVAFDVPGDVFRNETYPEYKANREETPDDIKMSIPYIRKIIDGFRIPIIEMAGFEADDVIGTIARQAEKEGFDVFMVTPDKDYGQLVTEHSKMLKPGRQGNASEVWGIKEICEKFGIERTDQVIDILGLQGDAVDNIPGVPGVGPKTAMKLIADYGTVEGVLEHSDELKGKLKERIQENGEQALLSKELATINCEVPVKFVAEEVILEEPDRETLREIFADLEFRTMSERILGEKLASSGEQVVSSGAQMDLFSSGSDTSQDSELVTTMSVFDPEKVSYNLIETKDKRTTFLNNLMKQKVVCFDTETTSIDANNCELVGMSFSWKEGEAYYIPIPENQAGAKFILKEFKSFFENKNILKIGHNLKYDITVLKWYEMEVSGPIFDTMIAHYLINPDMKHNMDELSETYLGYRPISIETLIGKKGKNQKSMRDIPVEEVAPYANEDADITYRLYTIFKQKVEESDELKNLLYDVEMPLVAVLAKMEFAGVKIDNEALAEFSKELVGIIVNLEKEIYELAGREFNIGSPKQLGVILFDELKIDPKPKKTKSGQYSTNEETLLKYEHDQPIVNKLLEYRQVVKLKSTYVDALPELVNPKDKRIHTTYMQAVAATGRLSSQNPNLQNIPIRTELGRRTREAFIPTDENHILFAADYSQIELRLIAHLSGDEAMVKAFNEGEDIHEATAAKVFDVDVKEVTREMRSQAKMVNFGIIYGISAFGLSQRLHVSRTEASDLINNYFAKYPGIKTYMDESIAYAREHGYVETILKRRRYLKDINGKNPTVRGFAERNAINAPIQGSAADMIKVAMVRLNKVFEKEGFKSKMILQVHDELVFDARRDELDKIRPIVEKEMMNAFTGLSVPMKVDMDTGENWLEAH